MPIFYLQKVIKRYKTGGISRKNGLYIVFLGYKDTIYSFKHRMGITENEWK